MSRLAPLVTTALIVLAVAFVSGAIGIGPERKPVAWGDRTHYSQAELAAWLEHRGDSYERWALSHPEAAAGLEARAGFPWLTLRTPPVLEQLGASSGDVAGAALALAVALVVVLVVGAAVFLVTMFRVVLAARAAAAWRVVARPLRVLASAAAWLARTAIAIAAAAEQRASASAAGAAAAAQPHVRAAAFHVQRQSRLAASRLLRSGRRGGGVALSAAVAASRVAVAAAPRLASSAAAWVRSAGLLLQWWTRQALAWLTRIARAGAARAAAAASAAARRAAGAGPRMRAGVSSLGGAGRRSQARLRRSARAGVAQMSAARDRVSGAWKGSALAGRPDVAPAAASRRPASDGSGAGAADASLVAALTPAQRSGPARALSPGAPAAVASRRGPATRAAPLPVEPSPEALPLLPRPAGELSEPPTAALHEEPAEADPAPAVNGATAEECEIRIWHGYVKSQFYAVRAVGEEEGALAASPLFRRAGDVPGEEPKVVAAHEALVRRLRQEGWRPNGVGEYWYEHRFRH